MSWLVPVLGTLALAARPVGWAASAVTVAAGVTGAIAPVTGAVKPERALVWGAVMAAGAAAFAFVAWRSPLVAPGPTTAAVALSATAAVAEELFFRRLLYARLLAFGPPVVAVAGAAVLFAAVHVPLYGVGSIPIDLTAGMLLGWQRWATGTWTAPAVTHVIANLVQL